MSGIVRQMTGSSTRIRSSFAWVYAGLFLLTASFATSTTLSAERPALSGTEAGLQRVVTSLKDRLSIDAAVVVSIVPTNSLMMSVEAPTEQDDVFRLAIDAAFLEALTDDEVEAAIAHELGHVWVFTHHPYLQTEELANQIAMRAVTRGSLERVYEKVWKHGGTKGDLAQFLGASSKAALTGDRPAR